MEKKKVNLVSNLQEALVSDWKGLVNFKIFTAGILDWDIAHSWK
jgi:hypothetical protein